MTSRLLLLPLLVVLVGCGGGAREPATHPVADHEATVQAYVAAVRAHYEGRKRGALSEPLIDPERVRFVYRYKKLIYGKYAEELQLQFLAGTPERCQVRVWYPRQGSNEEAPEIAEAILARMQAPAPATATPAAATP